MIARCARIGSLAAVVVTALALAGAVPASATTRFAEPGGNGPAGTCPQSDPCDLDTAVESGAVVDGDEVVVTPGAYSVTQLEVEDDIDIHGQALQPRPTINTNAGALPAIAGVEINRPASIRNLRLQETSASALMVSFPGDALVERIFAQTSNAGSPACWVNAGTLRDTVCWASGDNSSGIGSNSGMFAGNHTIRLRNVTGVATGSSVFPSNGIGLQYSGANVNVTVDAKSVIAEGQQSDVTAAGSGGATTTITLDHSNFSNVQAFGSASVTEPGTGTNQTAAPVFTDAPNGAFDQAAGSPTIDAGAIDQFSGSVDFEGDARVLDGDADCLPIPDIGADEYVDPDPPDCTSPNTAITSGPSGVITDSTPTFAFSATETGSSFHCRVDAGAFGACSSPRTLASLADGSHTFRVRATDAASNTDASPATRSFSVDTRPPETSIDSGPKRKTRKRQATIEFSADEQGSTFECSLDGEPPQPCTSPFSEKVKRKRHTFMVSATDPAGNTDTTPAEFGWKVKKKKRK